jgi:hypothetical protein
MATAAGAGAGRRGTAARVVNGAGWLAALALSVHLVGSVLAAPPPRELPAAQGDQRFGVPEADRRAIFESIASHAEGWWRRASRFPDDWSRFDDFNSQLAYQVGALASQYGLSITQVFLIYDEGTRNHWSENVGEPRGLPVNLVPLRPRTQ